MKANVQAWLDALPAHPGVLAWAVRFPEGGLAGRALDPAISLESLDNATRGAFDTLRVLQLHRLPAQYLQWSYERGTLHCLRRDDNWILAVVVASESAVSSELLGSWGEAFLQLQAASPDR